MNRTVWFRADGNSRIGLGHVMRLLAVAEMLGQDFHKIFLIRDPSPEIQKRILKICDSVFPIPGNVSLPEEAEMVAEQVAGGIFVLDSYAHGIAFEKRIRDTGCRTVRIDDLPGERYISDVIINHTAGIEEAEYAGKAWYSRLQLGPAYAMLRYPFRKAARMELPDPDLTSAFICLGGADPENLTLEALQRCEEAEKIRKVVLLTGSAYGNMDAIRKAISGMKTPVVHLSNLDATGMVAAMRECGLAICQPSTVACEYACVGGGLFVRKSAPNQDRLHAFLVGEGLALDLDDFGREEIDVRKMINCQHKWFDGKSDERIQKLFGRMDLGLSLNWRMADPDDMSRYFDWANEADTRALSFNKELITLETHQNWFFGRLSDQEAFLFVCEWEGKAIGQIRFELQEDGKTALINYSVDRSFRGKGFGTLLLEEGMRNFLAKKGAGVERIIGYVKYENTASNRIFQNLGFQVAEGMDDPRGAFLYELSVIHP
jgi:spore coat polysaccharide biosynthesis predicted glycosyltransferase SpsG/RimJ/RimL family protein N-acetyltransferase